MPTTGNAYEMESRTGATADEIRDNPSDVAVERQLSQEAAVHVTTEAGTTTTR
jgi:hypothetical protein